VRDSYLNGHKARITQSVRARLCIAGPAALHRVHAVLHTRACTRPPQGKAKGPLLCRTANHLQRKSWGSQTATGETRAFVVCPVSLSANTFKSKLMVRSSRAFSSAYSVRQLTRRGWPKKIRGCHRIPSFCPTNVTLVTVKQVTRLSCLLWARKCLAPSHLFYDGAHNPRPCGFVYA
jgi:hypothetical protein